MGRAAEYFGLVLLYLFSFLLCALVFNPPHGKEGGEAGSDFSFKAFVFSNFKSCQY
jgi:hypothetical protein